MTNSQEAKVLAHALEHITRQANTFFYQPIQQWLKIQVRLGNLTQQQAIQDFHFDEITDTTIDFQSDDWEETWAYGGHEHHFGRTIRIPFDFFDDETPYLKQADDHEYEVERLQSVTNEAVKRDRIKHLEAQLEKARKAADL